MTVADPRTAGALTNGFLPAAAFAHDEPTVVGVIDLDNPLAFATPPGVRSPTSARDAVALVRLHGDCLAVIHLDRAPDQLGRPELAQRLWEAAGEEIRAHVDRFGCRDSAQLGADALQAGLGSGQACRPARPESVRLSVVIPTVGRPDALARCLSSLATAAEALFEVIVVDNRPGDGETEQVVRSFAAADHRFRCVPEPEPGHAVARNRGLHEARGELLAFLDDDVVSDPGWHEWITAPFADPDVGAVTGMVLPVSLATPAQKRFERYAGFAKGIERRAYDLGEHRADDRFMYPFWGGMFGSGANMAFRRSSLLRVGGFDQALPGGEDTEALSRLVRNGDRLVYEPRALCWHAHRADEESLRRQAFSYGTSFGANLTKALLTDPRVVGAIVRSIPIAVAHRRRHAAGGGAGWTEPPDLVRAQRRGMMRGPWRYLQGRRRLRQPAQGSPG
jgi:GT2 family glycosyltransferase